MRYADVHMPFAAYKLSKGKRQHVSIRLHGPKYVLPSDKKSMVEFAEAIVGQLVIS
jgi:hypothetical protein